MSDATQISETEAIRQVIAEGGAMDYVDVVEAVRKKYGLTVSSALVEQVHLAKPPEVRIDPEPRIKLQIDPVTASSDVSDRLASSQTDQLGHALQFVKSVHGLQNAKQALADLADIIGDLEN